MIFGKFEGPNPPPALFGWMFVILGGVFVVFGWALAVAILVAAMKLKKRVSRTYCIAVGAFECMVMPFGTILGVFTIIILMREPVKQLFAATPSAHTTA